jgi:hypothetical protein
MENSTKKRRFLKDIKCKNAREIAVGRNTETESASKNPKHHKI